MDGKHLTRFQSDTSVFNFLRRSVDGAAQSKFGPFTFNLNFLQENSPLIQHQLHNDFRKTFAFESSPLPHAIVSDLAMVALCVAKSKSYLENSPKKIRALIG